MFKYGEKVRYLGGGDEEHPYFVGMTGTYLGLDTNVTADVDFPDTEGVWGPNVKTVYLSQLERVEKEKMPNYFDGFVYDEKWAGDSGVIKAMYYNNDKQEVYVEFTSPYSNEFIYSQIPAWMWLQWTRATSIGSFYNRNVKGEAKYPARVTPLVPVQRVEATAPQNATEFDVTFTVDGAVTLRISAEDVLDAVKVLQEKFSNVALTVTGVQKV